MLIKKYIGKDIETLVNAVDSELGPDAIILMTRTIERGVVFSFTSDPEIEITAGVEPEFLRKYNPQHESLAEVKSLSLVRVDSEMHINCSGPFLPDPEGVTLLAIVGNDERAVSDTCIKLIQHFHKTTPYRSALLCIKQILETIPEEFLVATEKNNIPYDIILDRFSLSESMTKYKDYDFLIAGFPAGMHETYVKSYLEGATPVWIELVVSKGVDALGYKHLHPQGIILNSLDSNPDFEHLPEELQTLGVPLSYITMQDKLVVAEPNHVENLVINSKLRS